jgi:hypothetical protein
MPERIHDVFMGQNAVGNHEIALDTRQFTTFGHVRHIAFLDGSPLGIAVVRAYDA